MLARSCAFFLSQQLTTHSSNSSHCFHFYSELLRAGVGPHDRVGDGKNAKTILELANELSGQSNPAVQLVRAAAEPKSVEPKVIKDGGEIPEKTGTVPEQKLPIADAALLPSNAEPACNALVAKSSVSEEQIHASEDHFHLLWPAPKHIRHHPAQMYGMSESLVVFLPDEGNAEMVGVRSAAWERLHNTMERRGICLAPTRRAVGDQPTDRGRSASGLTLAINSDILTRSSSFCLNVHPEGIVLISADSAGLLYGITTLCQLIDIYAEPLDESNYGIVLNLPCLSIQDYPDFDVRGAVIDARFPMVPRFDRMKSMVEKLASWRVNTIHLVLSDYSPPPTKGRSSSASTPDHFDLVELDALCQHFFIRLVPAWVCIQMAATVGPPSAPPAGRFRDFSSKQISLIFPPGGQTSAPVEQVLECINAVVACGLFNTVHLWGLPSNVMATVLANQIRWLPVVITAVDDSSSDPALAMSLPSIRFVKGGVSGLVGPLPKASSLLDSMAQAASSGLGKRATGFIIQGAPWANPMWPTCAQDFCHFAGAGIAWNNKRTCLVLSGTAGSADQKSDVGQLVRRHLYPSDSKENVDIFVQVFLAEEVCHGSLNPAELDLWHLHVLSFDTPIRAFELGNAEASSKIISALSKDFQKLLRGSTRWARQDGRRLFFLF